MRLQKDYSLSAIQESLCHDSLKDSLTLLGFAIVILLQMYDISTQLRMVIFLRMRNLST